MNGVFSLDGIGKRVSRLTGSHDDYANREIVMVLKAPRGEAVIFKEQYFGGGYYDGYVRQSKAVRAFVEQHRGE